MALIYGVHCAKGPDGRRGSELVSVRKESRLNVEAALEQDRYVVSPRAMPTCTGWHY